MTDQHRRAKAHAPTAHQRATVSPRPVVEHSRPGAFDGAARVYVLNGRATCPEGEALRKRYNANPPAEERTPILGGAAAWAEKVARRG